MLCEKCKNKKATLFYADEGGSRHSLCASCAAAQGKLAQFPPSESPPLPPYIPDSLYTALQPTILSFPRFPSEANLPESCPKCSTSLEMLLAGSPLGCPSCYELYASLLPASDLAQASPKHRMPRTYRKRLEKAQALARLKEEIKQAVASENYELAATLRDQIKKLEAST